MTDEELERLARAATAGPWAAGDVTDRHVVSGVETYVAFTAVLDEWRNATAQQEADAAFNPSAALVLPERVRKAEDLVRGMKYVAGLELPPTPAEEQLARIAATLEYEGPVEGVADAVKRSYDTGMSLYMKVMDAKKLAEAALACDHGAAEHVRAVAEAYRQGAEWMREKAAQRLETSAAEHRAAKATATPDAHETWEQTALTLEREAMAIRDLPLPEGSVASADARVALLAQQVVDALNDCNHGGGGTPVGCAGCELMLAALAEAGIGVEPTGEPIWPYWRLKT